MNQDKVTSWKITYISTSLKYSQRKMRLRASVPTWAAFLEEGWWWFPLWAEEPAEEEEPDRFQTGRWCRTKQRSKDREKPVDHKPSVVSDVMIIPQRKAGPHYLTWSTVLCCCGWRRPPITEYTLIHPSNDAADRRAGLRGHHCTSKHHWLAVGSS